jgi:hypothetical protein
VTLRTRPPTGEVAWPIVLVEGAEKVGKTYETAALTADKRIGRAFWFDLGEGSADEYGPIGNYEVVEHDGTFTDFITSLRLACAEPRIDDKPNVVAIDSGTVLWEALKDWAGMRARRSKKNRQILADDPDAEINVSSTYWNDANDRWGQMIHILRRFDGIAVIICRGKEVSKMGRDGNPVAGETEYRIEAQKALPNNVTAIVRVEAVKRLRLTGARSIHVEVPRQGIALPEDAPLAHLVFGILGAGSAFGSSPAIDPQFGRTARDAKSELVDLLKSTGLNDDEAKSRAGDVWRAGPRPDATGGDEISDMDWAELEAAVQP